MTYILLAVWMFASGGLASDPGVRYADAASCATAMHNKQFDFRKQGIKTLLFVGCISDAQFDQYAAFVQLPQ